MNNLIPPEGATEEQLDEFVASLRQEARAHVRGLLAAGAPEMEIADYVASLEPVEADSIAPDVEGATA
jgi:hypothetical protein